jgi:hypothetical protein
MPRPGADGAYSAARARHGKRHHGRIPRAAGIIYEDWLQGFDLCPVLVIPSQDLDFVNKPGHLDIVVDRVRERLSGKEDIVFPQ